MLELIPTYEVILDPDDPAKRRVLRVPRTHLEAFLSGLVFSRVEDFRVILEGAP